MAGRPSRLRETARRLAAGVILCLAAGAGLGDDVVQSRPDARRGSRQVQLDLPHVGTSPVFIPRAQPTGVVLLLHRAASTAERTALASAVPARAVVVEVDVSRIPWPGSDGCVETANRIEDISRRAQRDAGLARYARPVVVADAGAAPVAAAALAGASATVLPAAIAVGAGDPAASPACQVPAWRSTPPASTADGRWQRADSPRDLGAPLDAALRMAAREPVRDATPVDRWLRHFDLPLTAAWSSRPRSMLVLLSSSRGWRDPEESTARRLADAGVHVVGIDALESFWQRRSPRDVALELQRLTDALAGTGLPVYIGGREFGAETIAVAGEMMASSRRLAGVVLVDPGPTAFFEVEPPALALRPIGPSDWSTRAAVLRLERPTLCVTHAPGTPSALLCESLARRGQATIARTGREDPALAEAIAAFVLGR